MTLLRVGKEPFLALLVLALGLLALWETRELNEMSAVFPQTVGGILTGLGLFYLLYSLFRPVSRKGGTAVDRRRVLLMTTAMVGYVLLIGVIGFLPATLVFTGFSAWVLQGRESASLSRAMLFAVVVSVGFFLLFRYVFLVPFPTGIFGN
ncbi:tripartite tricarboxylate transporter TctB family protein [Planifilum fimeticola]|uniref:Tripartite tricarboxylate transporter TctB family protein n=1 Tax=Planifilum fimeticola TaxID=201975 RepID=A0A2T0LIN3_9BACL|nr:tripartite tricarboxylate transporter TctB family protein [Planifilum fimeticola]PRX42318.1 tripartite tricarboxylate transporter TctB family protein [Planifilum fimeticola]